MAYSNVIKGDFSRRSLLRSAATGLAVAAVFGTAACAGSPAADLAQVVDDVASIAQGLAAVLPQLGGVVSANLLARVSGFIMQLEMIATELKSISTVAGAQPLVQQVETIIEGIVSTLASVPLLPPQFSLALTAASVLLPVLFTAVGLVFNTSSMTMSMVAAGRVMTPAQARAFLRGLR
jgi:hypothetical protein